MNLTNFLNEKKFGKLSRTVKPLYVGPLTYEDENGDQIEIVNLPPEPVDAGRDVQWQRKVMARWLVMRLVRAVRAGNSRMNAAILCNLAPETLYTNLALGRKPVPEDADEYEQLRYAYYTAVLQAVEIAEMLAERDALEVIYDAALGKLPGTVKRTKTLETYKRKDGSLAERTLETEEVTELGPDPRAAMWILERTKPEKYGQKSRIEGTVENNITVNGSVEVISNVPQLLQAVHKGIMEVQKAAALPQEAVDAQFEEIEGDED